MKRLLSVLLVVAIVVTILPAEFLMASAEQSGDYIYSTSNSNATITGYTGAGGAITIPSKLGTYNVTSIGYQAFDGFTGITSVTIPNSVTSMGDYAFCDSGIKSITISNKIKSIGVCAFDSCPLTSVTFPNSVLNIGNYAFECCTALKSVTIPKSMTRIGIRAFYECSSLTSVIIPNSVTKMWDNTFEGCNSLVIFCNKDSYAHTYAVYEGIPYKYFVEAYKVTLISLANIVVNSTKRLTATISPSNASFKSIAWTSSNPIIATISSNGLVTAKAVGKAIITGTAKDGSGKKATCVITVIPKTPVLVKSSRVSSTSINISWGTVTDATNYVLYHYNPITKAYINIKTTTAESYINTGLKKGVTYTYKVRAYKTVSGVKIFSGYSAATSTKTY